MGLMDGIFGNSSQLTDTHKEQLYKQQKEALMYPEHARAKQNALSQRDDLIDAYKYGLMGQAATIGIGNNTLTANSNPHVRRAHTPVMADPNKDDAYGPPLAVIKDMWRVKWGDVWVSERQRLREGEFWEAAEERLWQTDGMERAADWCRLKE